MEEKSTVKLMEELLQGEEFSSYAKANESLLAADTLAERLSALMERKEAKKAEVVEASQLNKIYAYQILSGKRIPTRDKLLCLCIAIGLTLDEIQGLLKISGYAPLYPKIERDALLLFCIKEKQSVVDTNQWLFSHGQQILSSNEKL